MVVCRLYSDQMLPESIIKIINTKILCNETAEDNHCDNNNKISSDPFLRSMAMWLLKDYNGALKTLLNVSGRSLLDDADDFETNNGTQSVFNFYNFLRTHPLLVRQRLATTGASGNKKDIISGFTRQQTVVTDDSSVFIDKVTPMERKLFFATAHSHYMNGCPLLALEVLSKLPPLVENTKSSEISNSNTVISDTVISSGTISDFNNQSNALVSVDQNTPLVNGHSDSGALDWSTPISNKSSAMDLDWGAPVAKFDIDDGGPSFKISDDEDGPSFKISDDEEEEEEEKEEEKEDADVYDKNELQKVPEIFVDETNSKSDVTNNPSKDRGDKNKRKKQKVMDK